MKSIKRIDILFFAYLLFSTLFLVLNGQTEHQLNLLIVHFVIAITIIALITLDFKRPHPLTRLIRNTYPLIISPYFYSETVFYNKLIFNNIDPTLKEIEALIFGMQPSVKFSEYINSKIFSELMYLGYFSFYVLILVFTLYLFFHRKESFNKAVFQLSASLYIFYSIFTILPSAGPQFYFSSPNNILPQAYFFDYIIHQIQSFAEQPTGAFPSSHVGVSVIILMISRKTTPVFFKIALPFVILLVLSTVYIKAHYAIDIIGGLLIAPFILYLTNILYRLPSIGLKS